MGKIFLWAGQGLPDTTALGVDTLPQLVNQVARQLRLRRYEVLEVPAGLSLPAAITWVNTLAEVGDVAIAIETDGSPNPNIRGTRAFYIANNIERRTQAEQLLRSLEQRVPLLIGLGAQPDTATALGRLAFTRQVVIPSLVLRLGFETNFEDRALILGRADELAQGIASGLESWSRAVSSRGATLPFFPINISVNGQLYGEQGALIDDNAYVPIDIIDQLDIDIPDPALVRLVNYGRVTYVRAVDLRDLGIFVNWDAANRTVILQTQPYFRPKALGEIIGPGYLSPFAYEAFLDQVNPGALKQFSDIAQLYREEAAIEGVNPDVAFAQALLETNFFRFGGPLLAVQNNFGGIAAVGGPGEFASFPSARVGVRAHIQHLKAYGNEAPLAQRIVDPRFRFVPRGVAPRVELLSGRWSADLNYGEKVLAILRRLYEAAS